jgi:ribA/ribD-fused uncharacterized protein
VQQAGIYGFTDPFRFLSNFYPVKVIWETIEFQSVEHAYVAAKTDDFGLKLQIAEVKTPGEVKRLGRQLELRDDWEEIKLDVMLDLLIQKFSQEPFKTKLMLTKDLYLEETNTWGDKFWGVCNGVGENNLGKLLMWVRASLLEIKNAV